MTAVANAATYFLSGGPVASTTSGTPIEGCAYINLGFKPITVTVQQIFTANSLKPVSSSSNCPTGSAVEPNQSCAVVPSSPFTGEISCRLGFSEPPTSVRGTLQIYSPTGANLVTVELR
jgi:hypothetical protein